METLPWSWIWLILAALLYVGEMLSVSFFLLPFAVGASAATIASFLGGELWLQWTLMIVVSILALIATRPVAKKLTATAQTEKSGVDRLIGMTGQVVAGSSPSGENRARIDREVWNVTTESGERLDVGAAVQVLRVDGAHLIVKAIERTNDV
jgi:membrane protein implicated in regulation of membrane protease activity